jgi:hypothetical protein
MLGALGRTKIGGKYVDGPAKVNPRGRLEPGAMPVAGPGARADSGNYCRISS